jgi:hypothetical protein
VKKLILFGILTWFSTLSLSLTATANDLEYETQVVYRALDADYRSNPHFNVRNLNDDRDARRSAYLNLYKVPASYNNALPLNNGALSRVPAFKMLPYEIFKVVYAKFRAFAGKEKSRIKNESILTVINYDLPINARRLFVLDITRGKVLFNTYVAHGYGSDPGNTGKARFFGNTVSSNKTSLGGYVTAPEIDNGIKHPMFFHALEVHGLEASNSKAFERGILFHENIALSEPNMGMPANQRSSSPTQGCFGLSHEESGRFWGYADRPLSELIMETVRGGTFVYAYSSQH